MRIWCRWAAATVTVVVAVVVALVIMVGGGSAWAATSQEWAVDLRVDADRDGRVDLDGDSDERAEEAQPALVLANLDDDSERCRERTADGKPRKDAGLARCTDAADRVVNGPDDVLDLAVVRTVPDPDVPDDAVGSIEVSGRGRVFAQQDAGWQRVTPRTTFTSEQLASGLTLGVEATELRSPTQDGVVTVSLTARAADAASTDTVRLQTAPFVTQHTLQAPEQVLVRDAHLGRRTTGGPTGGRPKVDRAQRRFNSSLMSLTRDAGVAAGVRETGPEMWQQDYVEPGYAVVPSGEGEHTMRLLLRSDQDRGTHASLYDLRGRDVGVVWLGPGTAYSTVNSTGNLETIPPYTGTDGVDHPAGRVVVGRMNTKHGDPSPKVNRLLAAQGAGQDPMLLDTSWLMVGHVDEFIQFVPADTERGWQIAVADPSAAMAMLRRARREGHGDREVNPLVGEEREIAEKKIRPGVTLADLGIPAPLTVRQALSRKGRGLERANRHAARKIEQNLDRVLRETGATQADVIRVPTLFDGQHRENGWRLGTVLPNAVNNLVLGETLVAGEQFGLRIAGERVFAVAVRRAYAEHGLQLRYIDDLDYFYGGGGVHCGTNTLRAMTRWW